MALLKHDVLRYGLFGTLNVSRDSEVFLTSTVGFLSVGEMEVFREFGCQLKGEASTLTLMGQHYC